MGTVGRLYAGLSIRGLEFKVVGLPLGVRFVAEMSWFGLKA